LTDARPPSGGADLLASPGKWLHHGINALIIRLMHSPVMLPVLRSRAR
jgi:hypothetical protein